MEGVLQGYVEITADIRNINVKRAQDLSILLSKIIYAIIAINGMYSLMECTIEMFKYVTKVRAAADAAALLVILGGMLTDVVIGC